MKCLLCAVVAGLAACAALVLGGCGQKGPLYLPEKKGGAVVTTPAATPAPVPAGQPPQPSPAPQPQSIPESPPAGTAPPPKNSATDDDQKPK
jgi:predicted small lipoprotein YifL